MIFGLVDKSGEERFSHEVLEKMAAAWTFQLEDFESAWDLTPSCVRIAKETDTWYGSALVLLPTSDVARALGYHTRDPRGRVYSRVFTAGVPLFGLESVCMTGSHEILEATLDPLCNLWYEDAYGTLYSGEACDWVQGRAYSEKRTEVLVSDFVLPAFFDPMGVSKVVDHMGVLSAGFTVDREGGYGVVMKATGERTIWPEERKLEDLNPSKMHPASRTYQRLFGKTAP